MGASSVTGVGHGSASKISPPNISLNKVLGPKIVECGYANMSGGEVTVGHKTLADWDSPNIVRIVTSNSGYPVFLFGYSDAIFTVKSLETVSSFSFYWAILRNA